MFRIMFCLELLIFLLLVKDGLARADLKEPVKFLHDIEAQENGDPLTKEIESKLFLPGRKFLQIFNWIGNSFNKDGSFLGRCFGVARRLKVLIPVFIFKLGVIMTTLAFLTIINLKGLTIGIILLVLNVGGILGKTAFAKLANHDSEGPHHNYVPWAPAPPPAIHVHVHKDRGVHIDRLEDEEHYHPTAFSERISKSLNSTESMAERIELVKLYKRLGLDVNGVLRRNNITVSN